MNDQTGVSLSFDRAAEYYDTTRGDVTEIGRSVTALAEALGGSRSCLEIGVGTGRIALPLQERGFDIVGVDLSMRMMDKLRAKSPGSIPMSLVQADAGRLCFKESAFDAAYAIWVLHLISDWRRVLDELLQAVQSRGTIVIAFGGSFGTGPGEEISKKFRAIAGATNIGAQNIEEIDAAMIERGCEIHRLDDLLRVHEVAPAEVLKRLDEAIHSFTWVMDERTRTEAVVETRHWALNRYGDLERPLPNELGAAWRRYNTPA